MSALQALERVVDARIAAGTPIGPLVRLLTEGCENLATLGLVVGLLIRHLDQADTLLDPYFTEPDIWHLEFARQANETLGPAAESSGMTGVERRSWGLREAAIYLTLKAAGDRIDGLRAVGDELVSNARQQAQEAGLSDSAFVSTVRNWASALDRASLRAYSSEGQVYVQSEPTQEVAEALQPGTEDLSRGHEAMRLQSRYLLQAQIHGEFPPYTAEELSADLAVAKDLLDDPPTQSAVEPISAAVDVSAVALRCHFLERLSLTGDDLGFAIEIVLGVAEQDIRHRGDSEISYFEWGPSRVAARVLPILLLPQAAEEGCVAVDRVRLAGSRMASALAIETRLHLARGLDPLWLKPCQSGGACHHEVALCLATETVRDCALGDWDQTGQRRLPVRVDDPLSEALAAIAGESVYVAKLDALIRACGVAVGAATCVTGEARELLLSCVDLQTRGLLHEPGYDDRGSSALVTARALLSLAATGDDDPILQQAVICSSKAVLLERFLRALAAAAEETPTAAETARRIWPAIMTMVLDQVQPEHRVFLTDRHYGAYALAALIPGRAYDGEFLYRELGAEPIEWRNIVAWRPQIERWLAVAAGERRCIDALAAALESLPATDQVEIGLPWLKALVIPDPVSSTVRSWALATWLVNVRQTASDTGKLDAWQELVDALVVAGDTTLAPYSE